MKRTLWVPVVLAIVTIAAPLAAHATWVSQNCFVANHSTTAKTRTEARSYAYVADEEGYQWGGGCWDDDDVDDSPGDPIKDPTSDGEGPDCSGFTFKAWHLKLAKDTSGWWWWSRWQDVHGPYSTTDYASPGPASPFVLLASKDPSVTEPMDAFVDGGHHIAFLYVDLPTPDNLDYILEAGGEAIGTGVFLRGYRWDGDYVAVRRKGWTTE
jgi:hypothetical protein